MSTIQSHESFYVSLSNEEIIIFTKISCSSYPVWLGKNRAIMRDVVKYFHKHPPETLIDCLSIIGKFGLNGIGSNAKPDPKNFKKSKNTIDNSAIFW